MVDLETYRARIGRFSPRYRRRKKKATYMPDPCHIHNWTTLLSCMKFNMYCSDNNEDPHVLKSRKLATVLLIIFSLSTWLPNDDRYGKNRQRFPYQSEEEKKIFNGIRTLESKLVRAESHLKFFTDCQSQSLHPVNLEYNANFNVAFADDSMTKRLKAIDKQNIDEKIMLCINHFKLSIGRIKEDLNTSIGQLKNVVTPERYSFLRTELDGFRESLERKMETTKSKKIQKLCGTKINTAQSSKEDSTLWVSDLKKSDRDAILSNELLTDAHITTAMNILSQNHPIVVQPPSVFLANGYDYCPFETVQIAHNSALHWVLLSSMKGVVSIYDSLQMKPTESLLRQINQLFSPDDAMPAIKEMACHKQLGGADCGVFAIAYAVDILEGNNPEHIRYEQTKMRKHLVQCLETGKFTPFPKYRNPDVERSTLSSAASSSSQDQSDTWITPKRYNLRSSQKKENSTVSTKNQYSILSDDISDSPEIIVATKKGEKKKSSSSVSANNEETKKSSGKHQISQVVHNPIRS